MQRAIKRLAFATCMLSSMLAIAGCEKSAEQKLLEARSLVAGEKNPERAEKLLKSVLETKPDSFDAKVLLANAHRLQGDHVAAESQLNELAEQVGVRPRDQQSLSQDQRADKRLLTEHFTSLYDGWSETIDAEEAPEQFVDVVRRGLKWEPGHVKLNRKLVEFYWKKGQRLEQRGNKTAAAEAYEQIPALKVPSDSDKGKRASARARKLRLEAFKASAKSRWNDDGVKERLERQEGLSVDKGSVTLEVSQEFGNRIDREDKEQFERARAAVKAKLTVLLRKLVLAVSDLPDDADLNVIEDNRAADMMLEAAMPPEKKPEEQKSDDSADKPPEGIEISYRTITLRTRLSIDDIFEMAFDIQQAYQKTTGEKPSAMDSSGTDTTAE